MEAFQRRSVKKKFGLFGSDITWTCVLELLTEK